MSEETNVQSDKVVQQLNTVIKGDPFSQAMCDETQLSTMSNALTAEGLKVVNIYELGMRKYPGKTPQEDLVGNFFLVMAVKPPPESGLTVPHGVVMPGPGRTN